MEKGRLKEMIISILEKLYPHTMRELRLRIIEEVIMELDKFKRKMKSDYELNLFRELLVMMK